MSDVDKPESGQEEQETQPGEETTDDATGSQDDKGQNGGDEKQFTQAELDQIVKDRLEREKRKQEAAAQKAKDEAEAKALAEQQKWQELAQKHEKKLSELEGELSTTSTAVESAKEKAERYEKALQAHLKAQREGLADHILALLDKLDPVEQLEYIATNKDALVGKQANTGGGVPPSPKPKGDGELSEEERRKASASARTYF
jgi:CRISPR/Cas system-associated endonuclease/helicase Cas3